MGKLFTAASALALTAILATGAAYAIESADPGENGELVIASSTPEPGTTLAAFYEGYEISIVPTEFNSYQQMYIMYEIQEKKEGTEEWSVYKTEYWLTRDNERGLYYAEISRDLPLYTATDYRIKFTAWDSEESKNYKYDPIGVAYINDIKGSTERYQNSDITLVSMDPAPAPDDDLFSETVLPADCTQLTATFSGPVNINSETTGIMLGSGAGITPFSDYQPVDPTEKDGVQYAAVWHLVFSEGYMTKRKAAIDLTMKAFDEEGRVVLGNIGEEEQSFFIFRYNVPGMFMPLSFDFGPEPRSNVNSVLVSAEKPVNYAWQRSFGEAVVLDAAGNQVTQVKNAEQVFAPGEEENPDAQAIASRLIFDKTISEPGIYTLKVPAGYFSIGTEFDIANQAAEEVEFTVSEGVAYTVTPAAGKVETLDVFTVSYDVAEDIAIVEEAELPYLLCGESMTKAGFRQVIAEGKTLTLTLNAAITEPETYTLVVPTGYVKAGEQTIPNIAVEYVIEKGEGPAAELPFVATPAPGKVDALPEKIDMLFPGEYGYTWQGRATISFNGGEEVTLPDGGFDDNDWNMLNQPLGEFAGKTDEGTYTITFPAGYFCNSSGDPLEDEYVLTYTIGEGGDTPVPPVVELPCKVDPVPGVISALPAIVTMTFEGIEEPGIAGGRPTIQFNDEEPVMLNDAMFDDWEFWNICHLSLGDWAGKTEHGKYTIAFPDGYFVDDDYNEMPGFSFTYIIEPPKKVNVAVKVSNGVSYNVTVNEGSELNVTYTELPENWKVTGVTLDGNELGADAIGAAFGAGALTQDAVVEFELAYDGELTFIDKTNGVVSIDSRITIQVVDGKIRIENLNGEEVVVYNLGGMVMGRHTANNEALEITLPAGTYIVTVNGNALKVIL